MGDFLATLREKAQAHQDEAKAKRFRDRGGLWQPLSPSKNKLMAFLYSAEFQNIREEAPAIPEDPGEPPKVEKALKPRMDRKKPTTPSKRKGKTLPLDVTNETTRPAEDELDPVPIKLEEKKSKGKAIGQVKQSRKMAVLDSSPIKHVTDSPKCDGQLPLGKSEIVHPIETVTPKPKRKRILPPLEDAQVLKVFDEKRLEPQGSINQTGESDPPLRRPRRVAKKRNYTEVSDGDGAADQKPSPAKKSRTRAIPKASKKTKPTKSEGNINSTNSVINDNRTTQMKDNGLIETTNILSPKNTHLHPAIQAPTSLSSTLRPRKRSAGLSDVDGQSSPKRRRTRSVSQVGDMPGLDVDRMKPNVEIQETSKPRKRKAKPRSCPKNKGKSQKAPVDDVQPEDMESNEHPRFRNVAHLSTIPEAEEILETASVTQKVVEGKHLKEQKRTTKCLSSFPLAGPSSKAVQTLGMTKRKRKVTIQPEELDMDVKFQDTDDHLEDNSRRKTRKDGKGAHRELIESPLSRKDGVEYLPELTVSDKMNPPSSKIHVSKSTRTSQGKSIDRSRRRAIQVQQPVETKASATTKKRVKSEEITMQQPSMTATKNQRGKPPPLRDMHSEPAIDSDFDELDLLADASF
ncbi:hypothetical protein K439DRAFT_59551 [Ramaria rubella]|nr:hypothetical protein K439DRAFT_59551 [Ramaria rubella]